MNVNHIMVCVTFGILCVANVHAMSSEGGQEAQSASQSGDARPCVQASGWFGRLLGYCMVPENRTGLSRPVCGGARLWDGRDYCRPVGQSDAGVSGGVESVVPDVQQRVAVAGFQGVPGLAADHPLNADWSNPESISYYPGMGDKACKGLEHLANLSKWRGGIGDAGSAIELWASRCKGERVALQQKFYAAQQANPGDGSAAYARCELGTLERDLSGVCWYAMQCSGAQQLNGKKRFLREDTLKSDLKRVSSGELDYGHHACYHLEAFWRGIGYGLYQVSPAMKTEIDLARRACEVRTKIKKELDADQAQKDQKWWAKKAILNNVDGRVLYAVPDLFKRLDHCQFSLEPGYAVSLHWKIAPVEKHPVLFELVERQAETPCQQKMGDDACESLQQFTAMMQEKGIRKKVNVALAICTLRTGWLKTLAGSQGDQRTQLERQLLATDAAVARYSSDVSLGWQRNGSRMRVSDMCDDLAALQPYDVELGNAACRTVRESKAYGTSDLLEKCTLRESLLGTTLAQKMIAERNPVVGDTFRKLDSLLATQAHEIIRKQGWYKDPSFTGFCVEKP